MLSWAFSFICLFAGLRFLLDGAGRTAALTLAGREREALGRVRELLQELQESLEAGWVPAPERWEAVAGLPAPWGPLAHESLRQLRAQGASILPTLRRLSALAGAHAAALHEARAKAAQALLQSLVCAALVPLFGGALYLLLPSVSARPWSWLAGCTGATFAAASGALWLLAMAERARWGGLPVARRSWMLAAQCAGERFLALIRAGTPADLAFTQACELLSRDAPELATHWGFAVWREDGPRAAGPRGGAEDVLRSAGEALRQAVQVSLLEGRPCTERAEAALQAMRLELGSQVERELSLLATRALKPLFLCVAPSLLGLVFYGLYLSWAQNAGGF